MRLLVSAIAFALVAGCAGPQQPARSKPAAKPAEPQVVRKHFALSSEQVEAAKAAIVATLKDPESARFGNIVGVGDPEGTGAYSACGTVNAKNSYGGYVGEKMFVVASGVALLWDSTRGGANSVNNRMILTLCKPNA